VTWNRDEILANRHPYAVADQICFATADMLYGSKSMFTDKSSETAVLDLNEQMPLGYATNCLAVFDWLY
jgi:hypothetical protein